jgi:hypothetical protein
VIEVQQFILGVTVQIFRRSDRSSIGLFFGGAFSAVAFEDDFSKFTDRGFFGTGGRSDADGDVFKTAHFTAVKTEEVGVLIVVMVAGPSKFKTPDVVSMLGSGEEPGLAEVHEVAIDRGFVEAHRGKCVGEVGVREGTGGVLKFLEDGNACGGTAQPGFTDPIPQLRHRGGLCH